MNRAKVARISTLLMALVSCSVWGQEPSASGDLALDGQDIVVTGKRAMQADAVRSLTDRITRKARIDKPLSRFYQPVCLKIIGIKPSFAATLSARIEGNARNATIPIGHRNCNPNALVIFTSNARDAVKKLHRDRPWLFGNLLEHEYQAVVKGGEPALAWQTTEVRGVDGRQFSTIVLGDRQNSVPREVQANDQYQTGRTKQPIRVDMNGAVVVIDTRHFVGKSLAQLADYTTMRLFAATDDVPAAQADHVPTVLSLFTAPDSAPPGLTRFDRSYLRALYTLRPNANALAIGDATLHAWLRASGDD